MFHPKYPSVITFKGACWK